MARPVVLPKSFVAWLWPYLEAFSGRTRATVAALAVGAVLVGPRTVTTRGLRWLSAMLLVEVPFAGRICKCRVNTPQIGRMNIPQADATARFRSGRPGAV